MEAISIAAREDGEWLIVHECRACLALSANRTAGDDNAGQLVRLATAGLSTVSLSTLGWSASIP